jgi:hypothetical protein
MAGNGNSGQRKDKLIRDALMIAVNRVQEGDPQGRKKLAIAAAAVVEKAVEGDLAAFKEIADRIDGKAPQSVDVTTRHEQPITEWTDADLERVIADRSTSRTGVAAKAEGQTKPH